MSTSRSGCFPPHRPSRGATATPRPPGPTTGPISWCRRPSSAPCQRAEQNSLRRTPVPLLRPSGRFRSSSLHPALLPATSSCWMTTKRPHCLFHMACASSDPRAWPRLTLTTGFPYEPSTPEPVHRARACPAAERAGHQERGLQVIDRGGRIGLLAVGHLG